MKPSDPFQAFSVVAFFHFTDTRNITSIRKLGGLYSLVELRKQGVEIPAAGGNEWSHDADGRNGLDKYVHLCLHSSHPMEYRAKQEGRIKTSIFLEIDAEIRKLNGVLFTGDVSNKSGVQSCSIQDALERIDFDVLYTKTDWKNPQIKARLQVAEKCEILVPDHIPLKYIRNLPNG